MNMAQTTATIRAPWESNLSPMKSGTVNFPNLRKYGAIKSASRTYPPRPPHQVDRTIHPEEGDQTRHRDERRGAHPVCCGRHPVCYWRDMLAGNVEFSGRSCSRQDRNDNVEHKGERDDQEGPSLYSHLSPCHPLCTCHPTGSSS